MKMNAVKILVFVGMLPSIGLAGQGDSGCGVDQVCNIPALMALGHDCAQSEIALTVAGGEIQGGVHSNGELMIGAAGQGADIIGDVRAADGILSMPGSNALLDSPPETNSELRLNPVAHIQLLMFAPGGEYWSMVPDNHRHLIGAGGDPDFKKGAWSPRNQILSGLYYVEGDVQIRPDVQFDPEQGVTIAATGAIRVFGAPGQTLRHARDLPVGVLFFLEAGFQRCNEVAIEVSVSATDVRGLVIAPNAGIEWSASDSTLAGALIGWQINVAGSNIRMTTESPQPDDCEAPVVESSAEATSGVAIFETLPDADRSAGIYPESYFRVDSYGPGGRDWARASNRTRVIGDYIVTSGTLSGLYYVEGDVSIGCNVIFDVMQGVTIAATGTIEVLGSTGQTWRYYEELPAGVLLITDAGMPVCQIEVIDVAVSDLELQGLIIAPNGVIIWHAPESVLNGGLYGCRVDLD